jgi:hypothetical protein
MQAPEHALGEKNVLFLKSKHLKKVMDNVARENGSHASIQLALAVIDDTKIHRKMMLRRRYEQW